MTDPSTEAFLRKHLETYEDFVAREGRTVGGGEMTSRSTESEVL